MSKTASYFNLNTHHKYYNNIQTTQKIYDSIIRRIQKTKPGRRVKILDLGCGDGTFIKGAIMTGQMNATFIGTDLSTGMLTLAKNNLSFDFVELFVADAFKLPLKSEIKIDVIHMAYLLHHIVGRTRTESSRRLNTLIRMLIDRLSENGILIIEEIYYISYIIPHITSLMVFYGLKLLNFLHLDASKLISEYVPGLEVNFLSVRELERLLEPYDGAIDLIRRDPTSVPKSKRVFFLKDLGYMCYMFTAT